MFAVFKTPQNTAAVFSTTPSRLRRSQTKCRLPDGPRPLRSTSRGAKIKAGIAWERVRFREFSVGSNLELIRSGVGK